MPGRSSVGAMAACRRRRTLLWLLVLLVLVVAALVGGYWWQRPLLLTGTGYAAHNDCAVRMVAGRDDPDARRRGGRPVEAAA